MFRVAVLENQNKALIEELKSLKELYTGDSTLYLFLITKIFSSVCEYR